MPRTFDAPASALPRSLALSSLSYLTLVVALLLLRTLWPAAPPPRVIELPYLPPPPHIAEPYTPAGPVAATPPVDPTVVAGPVVPVAPDQAVDTPLPRQDSLPVLPSGPGGGPAGSHPPGSGGMGTGTTVAPPPDPVPGQWVPVDHMPVLVRSVLPEYPPIALDAGLEGTVLVLLLVGPDGRVKKAQAAQPGSLFDPAAIEAGRQFVFTPATRDGHPVSVWVAQPMRFVLH